MTELTPSNIIKFTQKAMILKHQIDELEKIIDSYGKKGIYPNMRTVAESYNKILDDCKNLLAFDSSFIEAISHLKKAEILPYDKPHQQHLEVNKVAPQLKMLKATLNAFFEWLQSKEGRENT